MKLTLLSALMMALCVSASAQDFNFLKSRPAHDGNLLSVEDIRMNRSLYPQRPDFGLQRPQRPEAPQGADNFTKGPDGKAAYTKGHSLYFTDAEGVEKVVALSRDDDITYGQTVSRNEFGISNGIFWSSEGGKIAFYRKDESLVTSFPLLDITTRTGSLKSIKYPMNGMDSERISLGVYSVEEGTTIYVDATDFGDDRYLTNISWSPDDRYIFIQVLSRDQHRMNLNMYDAESGKFVRTLLSESNDAWVEPVCKLHFLKNSYDFIYTTDNRDGYKNLYLCDTLGTVRRLTAVDADVEYVANDGKNVYYYSREISPSQSHLFKIAITPSRKKGISGARFSAPKDLTPEEGVHRVTFNADFSRIYDVWSSFDEPCEARVRDIEGRVLEHTLSADDPLASYKCGEMRFGTVKSADGKFDNFFRMYLPADFDPSRKYPAIVYVYGGPHSQMVSDSWLGGVRLWEVLMAQKGYVVYVQDNRGTSYQGSEYEKAINRRCGQVEMEDQMVGVNAIKSLPFVDADRIGVSGWSYGGFMTISLMTNYPETFKVGACGGPVIDWKWYEVMYGERYMDTPKTNPEGFERTSLLSKATSLKGKLLICQGAIDNTVVWEHSLSFVQECIENGVRVDYFPYPLSEHNVFGKWSVHLYDKLTQYFEDNL